MKRFVTMLVMSAAMLTACEGDPEIVPKTPTEAKIKELMIGYDGKVDMNAFMADVQRGVWLIDSYDIAYSNGDIIDGREFMGGSDIDNMMLLPNGICRTFSDFDQWPDAPVVYWDAQWSVSDRAKNTLDLYSPSIEESAKTAKYDQYAARTTLELLYYKDGVFVMKGRQPFAYMGGWTSEGIYEDYCKIVGRVDTDKETVDQYLSYMSYEQFMTENPDKFK